MIFVLEKVMKRHTFLSAALPIAGLAMVAATPALAQDAATPAGVSPDVQFIFNTLLMLMGGFLVMWMAAGFAMLEAGLVRTKNVSMQLLKNIALYGVAGILYWLIGYKLMYVGVDGGFFGTFGPISFAGVGEGSLSEGGHSLASDWFYQMVFCATAASVVSGTLAERIKIWPFMIFTVILTGFIYPIADSWTWGTGWLNPAVPDGFDSWKDALAAGQAAVGVVGFTGGATFHDFAGSTLVHSLGGWAALSGAILLGARKGKFLPNGQVRPFPGSSMPLATLGTFILWVGWFGFNGASQLAIGTISDASDVARIFDNTNLAAAAGMVMAMILNQILYKKVDLTMALNGALAGLVAITAEPLYPSPLLAVIVGAVGGVLVILAVPTLDKLKIDDVVGAIPVHLVCGIWGTLAVALSNPNATFLGQLTGVVSYGVFVFVVTFVIWFIIKMTMGIRVTEAEEEMGLDRAEIGVEAYPEFGSGSQRV